MNEIIKQDFQRLINDIRVIKKVLKTLENHRDLWARTQEEKDVSDFIKGLNKIETDLCLTMDDFVAKNHKSKKSEKDVIQAMQQAFSYVSDLFDDIKNIRMELKQSYIHSDELETLEIDLARFKKNILQALSYLQDKKRSKSMSDSNENSQVSQIQ